ncbi:MAG: hypothetical protein KDD45_09215 [Bdellovibrionales bacterium]|nr:hypothetical protein [Bdellovibrionales bacterium]
MENNDKNSITVPKFSSMHQEKPFPSIQLLPGLSPAMNLEGENLKKDKKNAVAQSVNSFIQKTFSILQ